jgi:hypothetical protein
MSRAAVLPLHRNAIKTRIHGVPGTAAGATTRPLTQFLIEAAVAA